MRRTKATLIYRRTKNLRAVQLLLGHSKLESTVRYLGIEVDDALEISEQTEIRFERYERPCPGAEVWPLSMAGIWSPSERAFSATSSQSIHRKAVARREGGQTP